MRKYLKLFRVQHYLKNILIFVPLVFSGNLFNYQEFITCLLGFVAYSFVASSIYIINDMKDIEKDKKHPIKKNRPLAAGTIKKSHAIIALLILLVLSLGIQIFMISSFSINNIIPMLICIYGYFLINIGYSFGLKNVPIIDLLILSTGFVLRILYGGFINNISISNWLFLTVLSLSLYLGLGKRRNEMLKNKDNSRKVLKYYNRDFLDKSMYMFLATALVFYALWCTNNGVYIEDNNMIFSIPLLYFIVMRYSLDIENSDCLGDPVDVVIKDKVLFAGAVIYGLAMVVLLYV